MRMTQKISARSRRAAIRDHLEQDTDQLECRLDGIDAVEVCPLAIPAVNTTPRDSPKKLCSRFVVLVFIPSILWLFGVPPLGRAARRRNSELNTIIPTGRTRGWFATRESSRGMQYSSSTVRSGCAAALKAPRRRHREPRCGRSDTVG